MSTFKNTNSEVVVVSVGKPALIISVVKSVIKLDIQKVEKELEETE